MAECEESINLWNEEEQKHITGSGALPILYKEFYMCVRVLTLHIFIKNSKVYATFTMDNGAALNNS